MVNSTPIRRLVQLIRKVSSSSNARATQQLNPPTSSRLLQQSNATNSNAIKTAQAVAALGGIMITVQAASELK